MEQYDLFLQSPEEVEPELVSLFQQFGAPVVVEGEVAVASHTAAAPAGDYKKC